MSPDVEFYLSVALTILFGAIATMCGFWVKGAEKRRDKSRAQSVGKISGRIIDESKQIALNIGGNHFYIDFETLQKGLNVRSLLSQAFTNIANDEDVLSIRARAEGDRLSIDFELQDGSKRSVFSIIDNEFTFNPGGRYDRNYALNAFEVVDNKGIPAI